MNETFLPRSRQCGALGRFHGFAFLSVALGIGFGGVAVRAEGDFDPGQPNVHEFPPIEARFVRVFIDTSAGGEPCLDEIEVQGPEDERNLALASLGAKASASSCLPGHAIHKIEHLNDGLYGNDHSWIAAGTRREWAEVELPAPRRVSRVLLSRDRLGRFRDRTPGRYEILVSLDGETWTRVARGNGAMILPEIEGAGDEVLRYAFACEEATWKKLEPDGVARVLRQMEDMSHRLALQGLDVSRERVELADLRREAALLRDAASREAIHGRAQAAKRQLFLRSPDLEGLERVLFVKRHAYEPSHNYSVILDAEGGVGGSIDVLDTPRKDGRLAPEDARVTVLFDAKQGIARDPTPSLDGKKIWFGYRPSKEDYFHLWVMNADGSEAHAVTDGPFHDYFPCPLPDGGLAFVSTRCKARFLCWRPQAFVLFRMEADGTDMRPLSLANLSEWTPALMRDGRIAWMRSEYLDKGADFGHTLWAIRPDGTHAELIFGNNTTHCYAGGREVPGTGEFLCTLVSHGGDLNGPLGLVDPSVGRFNMAGVQRITPDVAPHTNMSWPRDRCFRDPFPWSRDVYLASHAPADHFALYLVDRWGNREVLYLDSEIGCMGPIPLPRRPETVPTLAESPIERNGAGLGHFVLADVYRGISPQVERGRVKWLRVCQEVKSELVKLPNGEYAKDHEAFLDWYATPIDKVSGPHGWPSYVAKADLGLAPVESDGSASFLAPSGVVLYFEALDADLNELQRMRSVTQIQDGEVRSCVGCHEDRQSTPPAGLLAARYGTPASSASAPEVPSASAVPSAPEVPSASEVSAARGGTLLALRREPSVLEPPPWGVGPFSYEAIVQPLLDAKCVRCHDGGERSKLDLRGQLDPHGIPASYRNFIERGLVHHFDFTWGNRHSKADPQSFGTLKSRLFEALASHEDLTLERDELRRLKTWVDLNCPLWPDYQYRPTRPGVVAAR